MGAGNRVTFGAEKESMRVLHRSHPLQENCKILGVVFDTKLRMHEAVRELAVQGGWRLKALLCMFAAFSRRSSLSFCSKVRCSLIWNLVSWRLCMLLTP